MSIERRQLALSIAHYVRESNEPNRRGGDFTSIVHLPNGAAVLGVGDAAAKGTQGRYHALVLKRAFRAAARLWPEPASILNAVSSTFLSATKSSVPAEQFASLFVASIDTRGRKLRYASAGVEGALLFRSPSRHIRLRATGPLLGIEQVAAYEDRVLDFVPGNVLVAYTDGVIEARSADGAAMLGSRGLARLVRRVLAVSPAPVSADIMDRIDRYSGGFKDDTTLAFVSASAGS